MNIWVVITRFRGRSKKIEFFKHYNQLCFTIFYPGGLRAAEKSSGIYQQTNISRPKITHNQVVSTLKLAASSYQISCAQFQPQCSCLVQLIIAILDQTYHCYSHTEPGTNPVRIKKTQMRLRKPKIKLNCLKCLKFSGKVVFSSIPCFSMGKSETKN